MTHQHFCPDCSAIWECSDEGPAIWDQDDTDCRWWADVVCVACMVEQLEEVMRTGKRNSSTDDRRAGMA